MKLTILIQIDERMRKDENEMKDPIVNDLNAHTALYFVFSLI